MNEQLEEAKTKSASWVYVIKFHRNPKAKAMGYLLNDGSVGILAKDRNKVISGDSKNLNDMYHIDS